MNSVSPSEVTLSVTIVVPGCSSRTMADINAIRRLRFNSQPVESTVNVSIKNNAQIRLVVQDSLSDCLHCCLVLWVWNMIWKPTIWFQELTARSISPQRLKNFFSKKSSCSISCINQNMESLQWFFYVPCSCLDCFHKI
uniref:Phosphoglucomutase isoform X2 n=1 Tax=Rhizophora mucronata TaxID=61149 RepID=A0A2P2LUB3_RHIMU